MNISYKISVFLILIGVSFQAQNLDINFDGENWWKEFQKNHQAHLYNAPYSLKYEIPHYLWKPIGSGGSLLFDGYSTYMEIEGIKIPKTFNISFWIAPRAFDNAIDNKLAAILDFASKKDSVGFKVGLLKHGQLVIQYGIGNDEKRSMNNQLFLQKNKWNFVQVTQDTQTLKVSLNGKDLLNEALDSLLIDKQFRSDDYVLTIGRNSDASGFGEKFKFNMISGIIDDISIKPLNVSDKIGIDIDSRIEQDITKYLRLDYTKFDDDFRPNYHAIAPAHWMNEPHAPLYYNGKYHLFYQHNPFGPYWGQIHWGHWVSNDMVNWKHVDIALAPERGSITPDGIWSGSAYIGPNDTPMLFYTAANDAKSENQYTSIAFPKDKRDKNLVIWEKSEIIIDKPSEYLHNEFRDPFVFKIDTKYYMIVGSGIAEKGGTAVLFDSNDAKNWNYLHPFYQTDIKKYPYLGGVWELPVFLPLPTKDGKNTDKYVFMVLPLRDAADVEVFYWVGTFDKETKKFIPDHEEPSLLDYGDFGFTGQSGLIDPKTNRSIVFSIAQGKFGKVDTYNMGWAHNAGLPINLWLGKNNKLKFSPIKELNSLRGKSIINCDNCRISKLESNLKDVTGDQLEIKLEFKAGKEKKGIVVRKSSSGNPQAMIYYDPTTNAVVFDKIQDNPERKFTPLKAPLSIIDDIKLHIYLDKSMIEIYINNEVSITDRIYFTETDAKHIELMGFDDDKKVRKIQIWPMNSIDWEYVESSK
ncbi:GH32 C-terminal domain-containing protein [Mariniflexile sp. HNIBRBA6329]|uniref:GH32 C-terminal domain-containing protein n=1 Tax=Mariniflexile sp. HNIBRBA6329 TaxID=3373088 RepID=UPI00374646FE